MTAKFFFAFWSTQPYTSVCDWEGKAGIARFNSGLNEWMTDETV